MSLAIKVGLPDRRYDANKNYISLFNKIAEENGSSVRFGEQYHKPVLNLRFGPYNTIHNLRLQAAKMDAPKVTLDEMYDNKFMVQYQNKHLIDHEDNQGFYIPVDFERVIWIGEGEDSVSTGSSVRLDKELDRLWFYLRENQSLVRNKLPSEIVRDISRGRYKKQLSTILKECKVPEVLASEEVMWLKLKLAALRSMQFDLAIIFH